MIKWVKIFWDKFKRLLLLKRLLLKSGSFLPSPRVNHLCVF